MQTCSLPAISGYDPVEFFNSNKAIKGSGFHVSEYAGESYVFLNEENKAKFDNDPESYLPEFGGWCAFGAAISKKFFVNPEIFSITDSKLYLFLNKDIQDKWNEDEAKLLNDAEENWKKIKNVAANSL